MNEIISWVLKKIGEIRNSSVQNALVVFLFCAFFGGGGFYIVSGKETPADTKRLITGVAAPFVILAFIYLVLYIIVMHGPKPRTVPETVFQTNFDRQIRPRARALVGRASASPNQSHSPLRQDRELPR